MEVQKFTKDLFGEIRVVGIKGEPWFMAMDIACALGYSDTQAMTRRLDSDEQKTYTDNSSGQVRRVIIINESGLYNAIRRKCEQRNNIQRQIIR